MHAVVGHIKKSVSSQIDFEALIFIRVGHGSRRTRVQNPAGVTEKHGVSGEIGLAVVGMTALFLRQLRKRSVGRWAGTRRVLRFRGAMVHGRHVGNLGLIDLVKVVDFASE